jgi:hypothetical protein
MGRRIAGRAEGLRAHRTARAVQRGVRKGGCFPLLLALLALVIAAVTW